MKVGVTTSSFGSLDDRPIKLLRDLGLEVVLNPYGRRLTRAEAIEFIQDLDGLIAGLEPLDRQVLSGAVRLKAVARVGIGMDNVDRTAAAELGIRVSNTPGPPTLAVAEMTVAAILSLVRGLDSHARAMRAGRWEKQISPSLVGSVVHLVGFGRIGRKVATLLRPFQPELLVTDPLLEADSDLEGAALVPLQEGLARADVVSLHASGNQLVLGPAELSLLKEGAILVNSARGELVDEQAVLNALEEGHLRGVWFDAFWEEPYDGPLLRYDTFMATPHVATYTAPCRSTMETEAAKNLVRDLGIGGGKDD